MTIAPTNRVISKIGASLTDWPRLSRALTLAVAGLFAVFFIKLTSSWLSPLEERIGALGWTLFSKQEREERITLVVIDEPSLAQVGPWPWPRSTMAKLVSAINDAGAQLQIHDIIYPEPRQGDDLFVASLLSSSGALIAQAPALNANEGMPAVGALSHGLANMQCDGTALNLATTAAFIAPAANFDKIPKGHNSALIENDGGVRKSPVLVCVGDTVYPSLSLAAFMQLGDFSEWAVTVEENAGLLQPHFSLSVDGYPGLLIPVDQTGAMRIDFQYSPEAFRAVSAVDLITGDYDPRLFENSWVIVGGTAFGMADIVPTPYSGAAFGIELQARMLANILDMDVPYTPQGAAVLQLIVACMFAILLYSVSSSGNKVVVQSLPLLALLLPALAVGAHAVTLAATSMWVGWSFAAAYGLFASGAILLVELARARFERGRVYQNLSSYLPPLVAKEIALSLPSSSVDAKRKNVTLLHADIRNFSAFGEARPPEEIAAILHFFTMRVNEIVESAGGRIAEVRGDSVLVMWEDASLDEARQALWAAKKLQSSIPDRLLPEGGLAGLEPLALGIGIEQGPVMVGSIGPAHRRSFTVLGDTVSTTLRIQEMTAELAQPILLGSSVAKQLTGLGLKAQGSYLLPGLKIPHTLFAPAPTAEIFNVKQAPHPREAAR